MSAVFELRPISKESVPRALEKAERYRVLHEPAEAVSICRDVLAADPDNQSALATMLLALTDGFSGGDAQSPSVARAILPRLHDEYARAYYSGVIAERYAKAMLGDPSHECPGHVIYDWIEEAMDDFDRARSLAPPGNDDAVLRWNACVRTLRDHPHLRPSPAELTPDDTHAGDVPGR